VRQHRLVLIIRNIVLSRVIHINVIGFAVALLAVTLVNRRLPLWVGQVGQARVLSELVSLLLVGLVVLAIVLLLVSVLLKVLFRGVMVQHLLGSIHLPSSFVLITLLPRAHFVVFAMDALYWFLQVRVHSLLDGLVLVVMELRSSIRGHDRFVGTNLNFVAATDIVFEFVLSVLVGIVILLILLVGTLLSRFLLLQAALSGQL